MRRSRRSSTSSSPGIGDLEKLLNDSGQWPSAASRSGEVSRVDTMDSQDRTVDPLELHRFMMSDSFINDENLNSHPAQQATSANRGKSPAPTPQEKASNSQPVGEPSRNSPEVTMRPLPTPLQPSSQQRARARPPVPKPSAVHKAGNESDRRQTADAADLKELLRAMVSPAVSRSVSRPGGSDGMTRRLTADPDALQQLIQELSSSDCTMDLSMATTEGKAFRQTLNELRMSVTDQESLRAVSLVQKALDEKDKEHPPSTQPSPMVQPKGSASNKMTKGEKRGQEGGGNRRLTADVCSLETLVADLEAEEEANLPAKDQKKEKTPQAQRRTTASPTSLARLMQELDEDSPKHLLPLPGPPVAKRPQVPIGGQRDSLAMLQGTGYIEGASLHTATPRPALPSPSLRRSPRLPESRKTPTPTGVGAQQADRVHGPNRSVPSRTEESAKAAEPSESPPLATQGPPFMSPAPVLSSVRKPLRSCLSSKKDPKRNMSPPGSITKKSVVFGSPDAVVFDKNSPTTSLTPMAKQEVQRFFPQFQADNAGQQIEEEQPETGVTAENSAILAEWEADSDEDVPSRRRSTSSGKRRRSESRSPRPKRRQSLLLSRQQQRGVYGITDEEEEVDYQDLQPAVDMEIDKEEDAPLAMANDDDDDMPDIRTQPADFRSQDERTSAELGIIGGPRMSTECMAESDKTVELETDLHGLLETMGDHSQMGDTLVTRRRAAEIDDPEESFLEADITCHAPAATTAGENTIELEADLGALIRNAGTGDDEGAHAAADHPTAAPALVTSDEHTVDLEDNLNALVRAASGDERHGLQGSGLEGDGSMKDDGDHTGELDISLASHEGFQLAEPSAPGPGDFVLTTEEAPVGGLPRFSCMSDNSQPSPPASTRRTPADHRPSTSSMESTPRPVTRSSNDQSHSSASSTPSSSSRRPAASGLTSTNFFAISPCTSSGMLTDPSHDASSPPAAASPDDSMMSEASPFAHIQVGHLSKKSQSSDRSFKSRRPSFGNSSTSLRQRMSTVPSEAVSSSSSPSSITVSELTSTTHGQGLGSPAMTVSSSSVSADLTQQGSASSVHQIMESIDWAPVMSSLQKAPSRLAEWMQGLVSDLQGKGLASLAPSLPVDIMQHCLAGLASCVSPPQPPTSGSGAGDLDHLQKVVLELLTSQHVTEKERLGSRIQQVIARAAPRFEGLWRKMERQAVEAGLEHLRRAGQSVEARSVDVLTALEKVKQLQERAETMLAKVQKAIRECNYQRQAAAIRQSIDGRKQAVMQAQREVDELNTAKQECHVQIKGCQAFLEKATGHKQEAELLKKLEDGLVKSNVKAKSLEEKVRLAQALHLGQAQELSTEKLTLVYLHCDGTQTEVCMTMSETKVISLTVRHQQTLDMSMVGPLGSRLLAQLIRQCRPFYGMGPPNHSDRSGNSWALDIPTAEIPKAVRRLEMVMGRAEQLVVAVSRLEEAYACSLVMGHELLSQESWLEQCMFGTSTTCQFECGSEEEDDPSCLVIKAKQGPAMLAPYCAAVLTVELTPKVMVKLALSLGFLSCIPAKLIAEPTVLERSGREALRQAVSPFLFSSTAKDSQKQAPNTTASFHDDITLVLLKACQAIRGHLG